MDPGGDDANQFIMDIIAKGSVFAHIKEKADDASNTDIYLNMSSEGIEQYEEERTQDDNDEQDNNVYISNI
jgi:hypothetical protein